MARVLTKPFVTNIWLLFLSFP